MDWAPLDRYLSRYLADRDQASTVLASAFSASLEMVREGELELRQSEAFAPIFLRRLADSARADRSPQAGETDGKDGTPLD